MALHYKESSYFETFKEVNKWRGINPQMEVVMIAVDLEEMELDLKEDSQLQVVSEELTKLLEREITLSESGYNMDFMEDIYFLNVDDYDKFVAAFSDLADKYLTRYDDVSIAVHYKVGTAVPPSMIEGFGVDMVEVTITEALSKLETFGKDFARGVIDIDDIDFKIKDDYSVKEVQDVLSKFIGENIKLDIHFHGSLIIDTDVKSMEFTDVEKFKLKLKDLDGIVNKYFKSYEDAEVKIKFNVLSN